jgi:prevent-host-death family protein
MTNHDYLMVMSTAPRRPLRVAEFKARLSQYLREVRAGRSLVVFDRDTPVARVVPVTPGAEDLPSRRPVRRLADVRLPPPPRRRPDVDAALAEQRRERA